MNRYHSLLPGMALVFLSTSAKAHAIGLSRGDYRVTAQGVDVAIVLARGEVSAGELERGTIDKIRVTAANGPCAGALVDAFPTEQDGWEIRARYVCPQGGEWLTVTLPLLDDLSHGHRHAAHVTAGAVAADHLLFRQHASFTIDRTSTVSTRDAPSAGAGQDSYAWGSSIF
jgi:hypothetical protein